MDGTSYAIWAILVLELLGMVWILFLVKISSTRIETRIQNLKQELAEWLLEEVTQLEVTTEPPTPFTMVLPYLEGWLDSVVNPIVDAPGTKLIPSRGSDGQFS